MHILENGSIPVWLLPPETGFLNEKQLAALERLFDGIFPSDRERQIPGARDAFAANFVSRLLAMKPEVYVEIPAWRALYPKMFAALDDWSSSKFGRVVAELDDSSLIMLIAGLEAGTLSGLPADLDQKLVFGTLRRHCIQGCFADPRWGGNRDKIMWRAMGYLQPAEDVFHG